MSKAKKNIKVRDLKPTKDAKGGGGGHAPLGGGTSPQSGKSPLGGGTSPQTSTSPS